MKKFTFIMYPPNSLIPLRNSCFAECEEEIVNDLFIGQLLDVGWRINKSSIKEVNSTSTRINKKYKGE